MRLGPGVAGGCMTECQVVVVSRSNGAKTFGIVERVHNVALSGVCHYLFVIDNQWQDGSVDVKVAEGNENVGPQYHRKAQSKVTLILR